MGELSDLPAATGLEPTERVDWVFLDGRMARVYQVSSTISFSLE